MGKIRVLIADDHRLFREGLAYILNQQVDFEVIGEADDGLEALIKARELEPDLILMDVTMPGCDGLEATQRIKAELPDTTIVMLTVYDENEKLYEAIRNGAQGYLLKSIRSAEMLHLLRGAVSGEAAITAALAGRLLVEFRRVSQVAVDFPGDNPVALTAREQDVLSLVADGATNDEIAQQLHLSTHTVKSHMRKILAKLHLERRHDAASFAQRQGLIPPHLDT
jgi:DNA-binding NarL/FixJ family response regulator